MSDDHRTDELFELARLVGIETEYWDVKGERHVPSVDALLAVLPALGVGIDLGGDVGKASAAREAFDEQRAATPVEPVVVLWSGQPLMFEVRVPATTKLEDVELVVALEAGGERHLGAAAASAVRDEDDSAGRFRVHRVEVRVTDLPVGYHELHLHAPAIGSLARPLFVAPLTMQGLGHDERLWGVFAPVYSLAGSTGLGAHIGSLTTLARSIDAVGGKIVGTLPVLATWLGEPFDPSPYAPVSRRFWNELFVDLAALPELACSPKAASNLDGLRSIGHAANEKTRTFDYRHQYGFVRGVLEEVVDDIGQWPETLVRDFVAWSAQGDVAEYARFRAYAELQGTGWHAWPERQRSGSIDDADVDPLAVRFHEFGQYAMQRDLGRLHDDLRSRGQHLYLDLPVGAHSDGYDTWRDHASFAWGMSAGAPPDDFFAEGQTWGFPPLSPDASRRQSHRHLRGVLAHHMGVAGILRLDHVMGLHRLFWVPDGMSARDGVYVRSPRDELFAVVAIEAQRHDCVVIGEDLGTVPDEIRVAMDDHALLGMYVSEFNQPSWPGAELAAPRNDQLASIDTHDTPTFAGWLHALDIDRRHVLGQLGDDQAEHERAERRRQVKNLAAFLVSRGDVAKHYNVNGEPDEHVLLEGLLRFLGDSDAPAVLVSLDDIVGERNPQNVPGTLVDRPNWVQRFPIPLERLDTDERLGAVLRALQACRLGSHLRTKVDA